jgi:hypothetical protein
LLDLIKSQNINILMQRNPMKWASTIFNKLRKSTYLKAWNKLTVLLTFNEMKKIKLQIFFDCKEKQFFCLERGKTVEPCIKSCNIVVYTSFSKKKIFVFKVVDKESKSKTVSNFQKQPSHKKVVEGSSFWDCRSQRQSFSSKCFLLY